MLRAPAGGDGADLIFDNGRIYTVDARLPWAEAVAVKDGRILFVGRSTDAAALRGPATEVVDLGRRMMMPGLVDVHNHHTRGGQLDMFETSFPASLDYDEILALVRERALKSAPDAWIVGGIWSSKLVARLGQPQAKADLDAASLGRPVLLRDDSLHNRWVNSRALELMGVTAETPDPPDGHIVRDRASGHPVGLLMEKASALAERAALKSVADPLAREIASTRRAVEILNSYGVTAYQDANTTLPMLKALSTLDRRGELTAWCVGSLPVFDTLTGTEVFGEPLIAQRNTYRTTHVRPDFIKLFMDGVPPTRTAAMLEAYKPDAEGHAAVCRSFVPLPVVVDWIARAEKLGLAVKVHCAGDAAVRDILDAVEIVRRFHGPGPAHHIAHASFIDPVDLPRFKALNVVADLCPAIWFPCAITEANKAVIGDRADRYWPNRDLLEAGALLAAGSDWPVVGLPDPWFGLEGMVTRRNPKGTYPGALWPEQALDLETVLAIYTRNPALAMGLGDIAGSIEVGKSADLIVLDRNLFEIPSDGLSQTKVLATYFEGRLVHGGL
ncbi:MAG: amidohydrolase [Hyphomicrobiaceae bacterium]|nr:amidohydrolase [Hyphomicrobiaceae bacterium]